jgi:integrase
MPLEFGELMRLLNLDKLSTHLAVVRDHFLLMAFTGVRISDLNNSNEWHIYPDRIVHQQQKTEGVHAITLNVYSRQLIEKYSTLNIDGFRKMNLTQLTPQYMNRCLIQLAKLAHISKHISCHIGRHSYALLLHDIGVKKDIRAAELGHRGGRSVTQM